MEVTSMLLHSKTLQFGFALAGNKICASNNKKLFVRHFNKHLQPHVSNPNSPFHQSVKCHKSLFNPSVFLNKSKISELHLSSSIQCSYSSSSSTEPSENYPLPNLLRNLSFDKVKTTFLQLTPFDVIKWSAILSIAVAAIKGTVNLILDPFFWMYFSWTWLFWPWFVAVLVALYGSYCFYRYSLGEAGIFEQLAVVTSAFTWLTLVPPAYFNGYLEGWPVVFFFVYHYFFFFNVSVRERLYGDIYPREHDPKWDVNLPKWQRILFCVGVMVGHWLAAFEGPELHLVPGGRSNVGIWILIMIALLSQYKSTFYLAKYSEKVVVPTAVVQFGPYRWVRHPIYASTVLLLATYFLALRAPLSLLFVVAVCLMYYTQKAKLEEALMIETFGELYEEYMSRVRYKFIPLVY